MMRTLYFDCFSGISGDMVIGALIDAGADPLQMEEELKKLNIDEEYTLSWGRSSKMALGVLNLMSFSPVDQRNHMNTNTVTNIVMKTAKVIDMNTVIAMSITIPMNTNTIIAMCFTIIMAAVRTNKLWRQ